MVAARTVQDYFELGSLHRTLALESMAVTVLLQVVCAVRISSLEMNKTIAANNASPP